MLFSVLEVIGLTSCSTEEPVYKKIQRVSQEHECVETLPVPECWCVRFNVGVLGLTLVLWL